MPELLGHRNKSHNYLTVKRNKLEKLTSLLLKDNAKAESVWALQNQKVGKTG